MKKWLPFVKTFRFRILVISALCWLLPMVVLGGYLGGSVIFSVLREQTESALLFSADAAQADTVAELDRIIHIAKSVTYDGTIAEYARAYQNGSYRYQDMFRDLRLYMDRTFSRERAFSFAAYFPLSEPGQIIATTPSTQTNDLVLQFQRAAQGRALQLGETLDTRCYFMTADGRMYLVRNLLNRRLERFGMLVIGIRPERLFRALEQGNALWEGKMRIELDDHSTSGGTPVLPVGSSRDARLQDEGSALWVTGEAATRDYRLRYRAEIDKGVAYARIYQFYQLMIFLTLLLLPVEAMILMFVQRRLTRPLHELASASWRIERGDLGVTVPIRTADEVGGLARCYNAMSLEIKRLIEKSFEEELTLRDARIEALQSRINPHFLNNTLEMINWQARIEGSETISRMIDAMSTLINASMDRESRRVVPLSEELRVADAYFYFLDQRFGAKLSVEREVDSNVLREPVPRLAIQTLLENAVDHGIAPAGGGQIRLRAREEGGMLVIEVANTGKWLSAEDAERIKKLLSDDDQNVQGRLKERLGIRNINRRVKLIYGARATLRIGPDESGATRARLCLPIGGIEFAETIGNEKQQNTFLTNDISEPSDVQS